MTIRFNTKRKKSKKTVLVAFARHQAMEQKYYTGIQISPQIWNNKKQTSNDPVIDQKLQEIKTKIFAHFNQYHTFPPKQQDAKTPPKKCERPQPKKVIQPDIAQSIQEYCDRVITNGAGKYSKQSYDTLIAIIRSFNNSTKTIHDINQTYLEDLVNWMRGKAYADSHITKIIKTLKRVMKANKVETDYKEFKDPKNRYRDQIYLNNAEIESIAQLDLSNNPRYQRTVFAFLRACYTGQRYSDIEQITIRNIIYTEKHPVININQTKTNNQVSIPVSPRLKTLLQQYGELKAPSNQEMNRVLKEVAKMADIKKPITIALYKGGKRILKTLPKYQLVTTHTARRSFATNALMEGMADTIVMKFTGHQSYEEFRKYIRVEAITVAQKYATHSFFQR